MLRRLGLLGLLGASLVAGSAAGEAPWARYRGELPPPIVPADNPYSDVKFELGRQLFYDSRLSANGTIRCASCHLQELAFTDGRAVSLGATGEATARNAQGLANVAWHATLTWANPALVTIERQMEVPLFGEDPVEMGVNDANLDAILERLRRDPAYRDAFSRAFPPDLASRSEPAATGASPQAPISWQRVIQAIATFVRGLVSADSRFDRYQRGELALTDAERRGKDLFFGELAECHHCHGSFNFNDQVAYAGARTIDTPFHNTGLYDIDGRGAYPAPNRGVYETSGRAADMGAFRAPSLRNVAVTGPYMHDGSIATLAQVLEVYASGGRVIASGPEAGDGRGNPHRSDLIGAIQLSAQDKHDLLAFLHSLTDACFLVSPRYADPALPPRRDADPACHHDPSALRSAR